MTGFRAKVRAYFMAHPDEWVSADDLARIGGRYAWRTRVSDVRRLDGLTIVNRVRTVLAEGSDVPQRAYRVSEYCYVPANTFVLSA